MIYLECPHCGERIPAEHLAEFYQLYEADWWEEFCGFCRRWIHCEFQAMPSGARKASKRQPTRGAA